MVMRRLTFMIALLTMTAYALGLPVELHLQEHRQSTDSIALCISADHAAAHGRSCFSPLSVKPQIPSKAPAHQDCPTCVRLQAAVAAPDTPIVIVHAAAPSPEIAFADSYLSMHAAVRAVAARGPPA